MKQDLIVFYQGYSRAGITAQMVMTPSSALNHSLDNTGYQGGARIYSQPYTMFSVAYNMVNSSKNEKPIIKNQQINRL